MRNNKLGNKKQKRSRRKERRFSRYAEAVFYLNLSEQEKKNKNNVAYTNKRGILKCTNLPQKKNTTH